MAPGLHPMAPEGPGLHPIRHKEFNELTISYQLLCITGHRVLHQVVIGIDTIHPQAMYLLVDNSLRQLEELHSI